MLREVLILLNRGSFLVVFMKRKKCVGKGSGTQLVI